jgi:hypothetical protein
MTRFSRIERMGKPKSMVNHSSVGFQWPAPKVPEGAIEFDGPDWHAPNGKRRQTMIQS